MAFMVPDDEILKSMYSKILGAHFKFFDGRPFEGLAEKFV